MRIIKLIVLALLALSSTAFAADVRGILVIASNQRGESDGRLSEYEPTLRRILRFESYRVAGEGSASLNTPGKASINLGRGHALKIDAEKSDGNDVKLRVQWQDGARSLMNTGLSLRPGVPAVLGGPSTGKEGEVWAIILVAN
jgi:hypothetical protein